MNNNPALIIDGLLLLIIVIGAIQGYRDGFFTSVIRLIGTAGSFFAALFVSDNYSQQIFDSYIRQPLTEHTYNYLVQTSRNIDVETAIGEILGHFPQEYVTRILEKAETLLSQVVTPDMESAVYLVENFLGPLVVTLVSVILFILTFIAVKLVCNFMAWLFQAVNSVPLLGTANQVAGLVTGVITGGINIILLSFILSIIVTVTGDSLSFLNTEIMSQSYILALAKMVNPLLP